MEIFRDEERIEKLRKRGQRVTLIGFLILLAGFIVVFINTQNLAVLFQLVALLLGFTLTQYGVYLTHRYGRSPRPDEVLDDALKPAAKDGRLYHYLLPAPHVLLTKTGIIVFVLKYQVGNISVVGDRWRQTGVGFRRFFGQEGLGNPTKDADSAMAAIANYLRKNAPEIAEEDLPIAPMIIFTSKAIENLDLTESSIPAMHFSKLKGYLRQKGGGEPLPEQIYLSIQKAFDLSIDYLV